MNAVTNQGTEQLDDAVVVSFTEEQIAAAHALAAMVGEGYVDVITFS